MGVRGGKSINNVGRGYIHLRVIVVRFPECLAAVLSKQAAVIDQ